MSRIFAGSQGEDKPSPLLWTIGENPTRKHSRGDGSRHPVWGTGNRGMMKAVLALLGLTLLLLIISPKINDTSAAERTTRRVFANMYNNNLAPCERSAT